MFGPLLAVFAEKVGGDLLDVSWAWAIFLIVHGVLSVIVGKYFDGLRSHRAKVLLLLAGYALNAAFTFGFLFVHTTTSLFIVELGLGVAAALATPTWNALFALHMEKDGAGGAWGLENGFAKVATGLAIVIGGMIVSRYSFEALFIIMGILQVIATVAQARILKRARLT